MNIKIVDSWLREFIQTKATTEQIAKQLSLKSVSVEKTEKVNGNFIYDIEVTTNRVDLMSVRALAKETAVALNQEGITSKFIESKQKSTQRSETKFPIEITAGSKLVNRICGVVMEVKIGESPKELKERLELSGIRSLNNLIDVTNYVMLETGHPAHVFDFDLLTTKKMIIRESKLSEKITTLDDKTHTLQGGDIVADDGSGRIIDLLGIMGTKNSVVNDSTKRILFFLDNNNPVNIRRTSMNLGIRTQAAVINEKGIDPELMTTALDKGIELYQKIANGKVISEVFDYYPNKAKTKVIKISFKKINSIIGVEIKPEKCREILEFLGFKVKINSDFLETEAPTSRSDIQIDVDIIEEIARIYGFDKLSSIVPTFLSSKLKLFPNNFYFENKAKNALKYWGFTECYTNSLVSEDLIEGPTENALRLKNPLSLDLEYLRNALVPSLLQVLEINKSIDELKIFEISNIYIKRANDLPKEILTLSGIIKNKNVNFYKIKGIIEQLLYDLGITNLSFKKTIKGGMGTSIYIEKDYLGEIEVLDTNIIDFELNFETILEYANINKAYTSFAKFPPIIEDISIVSEKETQELINLIRAQSVNIVDVSLKDIYKDTRTFHIIYQDFQKNLTNQDVTKIREKMIILLKEKFKASIKE